MQWFKVPSKIYFESGSISYLQKMPNISNRVNNCNIRRQLIVSKRILLVLCCIGDNSKGRFIVTDPAMTQLGYVNKILYQLRRRSEYVQWMESLQ